MAIDYTQQFEKMRPFTDCEVPEAINRIINDKQFGQILAYLYPDHKNVKALFKDIKTVSEFQSHFSHHAVKEVVNKTSDGLTFSGVQELDKNKPYLFIANHRDIVLDSAIMQAVLLDHQHKTSQITFGSNLMSSDFIVDLGKLNKMFTFYREGSKIQRYRNAILHSNYIRSVLTDNKESIWIAQRDGRTKDGNDKTQVSLFKMLAIGEKDTIRALQELNIVPVTISYEYEPCDANKINEVYLSEKGTYTKKPNEDFESILSGITGFKGKIHINFGKPLNHFLEHLKHTNTSDNDIISATINEMDCQMYKSYALWPINYLAYDMLNQEPKHQGAKYTTADEIKFTEYMNKTVSKLKGDKDELNTLFLQLYATPVANFCKTNEECTTLNKVVEAISC